MRDFGAPMATLLIVSEPDIASRIQGEALLNRGGWNTIADIEGGGVWVHENADVYLWWFPNKVLHEDNLDLRFSESTSVPLHEVIFLTRHYAASGRPSLTLHVIGVPGELPHGEHAEFGGLKGSVVLPNPRFAAWYRLMCNSAIKYALVPEFELTIETTHHGPVLSTPTMFVEIGSSESHWGRKDAAEAWADVITIGLQLDGIEREDCVTGNWWGISDDEKSQQKVMIGVGGGHYAPRHTDVLRKTDCWAGHQLANYALNMEKPDSPDWDPKIGELPLGAWNHAIRIAVSSTSQVYDGANIMVHLDRKSFKGWQRQAIRRLLEELNIDISRTKGFEIQGR